MKTNDPKKIAAIQDKIVKNGQKGLGIINESNNVSGDLFNLKTDKANLPQAQRSPKNAMAAFNKATEAESKILFQHNLNEGKRVRSEISRSKKRLEKDVDVANKEYDKKLVIQDKFIDKYNSAVEKFGQGSNEATAAIDKVFKADEATERASNARRQAVERHRDGVTALLQVDNPTKLTLAPGSQKDKANDNVKDRRKQGVGAFQNLVSDDVIPRGTPIKHRNNTSGRAFHRGADVSEIHMTPFDRSDTVVHELGHAAENYNPRTVARSIAWRNQRTEGEQPQKLRDVDPQKRNFDDDEVGKPDKFYDVYIGKDYGRNSSEVFSMGIQRMMTDPAGFAEEDPDMFDFIYAQARTP